MGPVFFGRGVYAVFLHRESAMCSVSAGLRYLGALGYEHYEPLQPYSLPWSLPTSQLRRITPPETVKLQMTVGIRVLLVELNV